MVAISLLAACGGRGEPAIKATPQIIRFGTAPTLVLHGSGIVSATASSDLTVSYNSTTPTICSIDGNTGAVTGLTLGTCVIAADQPGNDNYAPAPQTTLNIVVTFDPHQIITFASPPALTLFGSAVVSATTNSGLAVSYSSTTPTICIVNSTSGAVTSLAVGSCIIAADQAGNASYFTAPQVTQTIAVPAWVGAINTPNAPANVAATAGTLANTVTVSFFGPSSSGGSPITGYTVFSSPAGITATGTASPITVNCPASCSGYAFSVLATNAIGNSPSSALIDVLTNYNVIETFFEPDTQPNNTIFTGIFTLDSTTSTVSNLKGSLTESMTNINNGLPMALVSLPNQLSSVSDGIGGLLVTTFSLNTTNTFTNTPTLGGTDGWAPGSGSGLYYGFPSAAAHPSRGAAANAYAMIYVNLTNPITALTAAQLAKLAYADCTAGGMMGDVCMTGTSVAGYGAIGTMSGYPLSQIITRQ